MKLVVAPRMLTPVPPPRPMSTNLIPWLPYLWQTVLFPGRAETTDRLSPPRLILLIAVAAFVCVPCLGFHLFEPDEGRYAQIPREMLERGDLLTPVLQGEPYLDKPPLFYWLVIIAYKLFGTHDWAARLVPVTAVLATVATSYVLGRRSLGEKSAFWGTLMLALAPGLVSMGRILVLDGLLTLWVTLATLTAFEATRHGPLRRGWWRAAGVALAFGTLTKGPIALILVAPPLFAYRWLTGRPGLGFRPWLTTLAIIAAINLPWYIAISLREPEFLEHFLWKHNLQRFLTPFDHEEPFWYFLPVLAIGLVPFVWMAPLVVRFLFSDRPARARRRSSEMGFFLLSGLWCVGFFSLSGSKLPTYILPAFPPLCLALGSYVVAVQWHRRLTFVGGFVVWAVLLMIGHTVVLPKVAWHRSPMNHDPSAWPTLTDPNVPIYCYPRPVDSVAFYTNRSDFQVFRSKELAEMLQSMDKHSRSVILFAHRNSTLILSHNLPPHFRVVFVGRLGLCEMAIVER